MYLQYTSGSTRTPAGVMVSNRNVFANFEQIMAGYFADYGKVAPPDTTVVSWLPFYHDMGFFVGIILPILSGFRRAHKPGRLLAAARPMDAIAGKQ